MISPSFGFLSSGLYPKYRPNIYAIRGRICERQRRGVSRVDLTDSNSLRPFVPVAPPVNRLDIIGVIVSPGPSHAPRVDMVRYDIAIVRELGLANAAFTALGYDLSIEQLSHLPIGAEFSVSPRVT
jgi:hypothetical protein